MKVETLILKNLLLSEEYVRKALPFVKDEYFPDLEERVLFDTINKYFQQYSAVPTKEALLIEIGDNKSLSDEQYKNTQTIITSLDDEVSELDWVLDTTEKWCKERAIYLALMESIKIAEGNDGDKSPDAIPSILSEALSVSFDNHIGHDYIEDYEDRYESYHRVEDKIPFDIELLDKITKGGLPRKTLNVALAGTGVGKSLFMCHVAGAALTQGYNVLYITCEMAEEKIAERIDANCLNINIKDLTDVPQVMFRSKIADLQRKTTGKLIIKEYPTASAHAGHFRSLLNDLTLKKSFKPDIIFIDYLNICASVRYKGAIVNSYTYVKAIAEELRGLACEFDVPIVSATQTTRSGYGNSEVELTDTSESFGLPATADLMFALISTEELEGEGKLLVKQLKNRYNDLTSNRKFVVGIDRSKMKLFDVADSENNLITEVAEEEVADSFDSLKKNQARLSKFAEWNY